LIKQLLAFQEVPFFMELVLLDTWQIYCLVLLNSYCGIPFGVKCHCDVWSETMSC